MSYEEHADLFGPSRSMLIEPSLTNFIPRQAFRSDPKNISFTPGYEQKFLSIPERPQSEPMLMVSLPILRQVSILDLIKIVGEPYCTTQYQWWSVVTRHIGGERGMLCETLNAVSVCICKVGGRDTMAGATLVSTGRIKLFVRPVAPIFFDEESGRPAVMYLEPGDRFIFPRKP